MKKNMNKLLALFLALVMCLSLLPLAAFAESVEGDGDEENKAPVVETTEDKTPAGDSENEDAAPVEGAAPEDKGDTETPAEGNPVILNDEPDPWADKEITISTVKELEEFAAKVNEGTTFKGQTITLGTDIDLSGIEWTPIGTNGKPFDGTFDGANYTISNLSVSGVYYVGLFGCTSSNATIKNLTLENAKVEGSLYVAAVVGYPYVGKEISNVTVKGDIQIDAWWYAGVIGGYGYLKTVKDCAVEANEGSYIRGNDGSYIGGIWGFRGEGAQVTRNCTVSGLSISGVDRIGGISGIVHYGNEISNCKVTNVTITATNDETTMVGWMAGACEGKETSPSVLEGNSNENLSVTIGGKDVTESVDECGTKTNGTIPVVQGRNVAMIGETGYQTLAAAINAAEDDDTVKIIVNGEYAAFAVPAGVKIEAAEGKDVTFTGCFTKVGANVTFDGITFKGAAFNGGGDNLTVTNCHFVGDGSGTAMYIHTPNITVTGCTFENYWSGYYTCGDNHAAGKQTFTGNTFVNVTVPFAGYWGKAATDATELTITDNTFSDGSYVQLWDYTQYNNSSADDRQGTALKNVIVTGNTGNYQLVLIHTDWRWATGSIETDAPTVVYSHHVDINMNGQENDIASITAKWAGEGKMPGFEDKTTPKEDGFYHLPEGDYTATVTYKNGVVKTQNFTVTAQTVGETQTLVLTTDKAVAQVGEDRYDTLAEAIEAVTEENSTVTLLADIVVDSALNIDNAVTIDGNGYTLSRKSDGVPGSFRTIEKDAIVRKTFDTTGTINISMFTVAEGAKLTLSNVKVDEGAKWTVDSGYELDTFIGSAAKQPLITVAKSATLVLNSTTIQNIAGSDTAPTSTTITSPGAAISADGGVVELNNSTITGCVGGGSGIAVALVNAASLTLNGSHLDGNCNYESNNHSIVKAFSGSKVAINTGSSVSNNYYHGNGMIGVHGSYDGDVSTLIIDGGQVNGNRYVSYIAPYNNLGAPIELWSGTIFEMYGGEVKDNVGGVNTGVDVGNNEVAKAVLMGGTISGNTTSLNDYNIAFYAQMSNKSPENFVIGEDFVMDGNVRVQRDADDIDKALVNNTTINGDVYLYNYHNKYFVSTLINHGTITGKIVMTISTDGRDTTSMVISDTRLRKFSTLTMIREDGRDYVVTETDNGDGTWTYRLEQPAEGLASVALDRDTASLTAGNTTTLTATTNPGNAVVTWSSSDKSVATVDANGVVTAVAAGTVTITAKVRNLTAECTVTVTAAPTVTPTQPGNGGYTPGNPGEVEIDEPDVPLAEIPLPFVDVNDDDWFREAVAYVYVNDLMGGTGSAIFAASAACTRATLATVLYRLEKEPTVSFAATFTDVANGLWYSNAIEWGALSKILNGYGGGKFGPSDKLTREQIATVLFRYAKNKGYDVSARGDLSAYPDGDQVSSWAKEGMSWAVGAGLIKGSNGKLNPGGFIDRAQTATVFQRFCEKFVEESGKPTLG